MNHGPALVALQGFFGLGQSGNSGGQGTGLDPASSNADMGFCTAPLWGQE